MRYYNGLIIKLHWFLSEVFFIWEQSGPGVARLVVKYEEIELSYSDEGEQYWNDL